MPQDEQCRAWRIIRDHRSDIADEVWFAELACLDRRLVERLGWQRDIEDMQNYFRYSLTTAKDELSYAQTGVAAFLSKAGSWLESVRGWSDDPVVRHAIEKAREGEDFVPNMDPKLAGGKLEGGRAALYQFGGELSLVPTTQRGPGSAVALLASTNGLVELETRDDLPHWPDRTGTDEFGGWAEIDIDGVTQRLRRIPAGSFVIGSPEDEKGRWVSEGPQTEITIGAAFWMFDTVVTEAFWSAVMGDGEPANDRGEHPKTHVSWNDANAFIERLNGLRPGLSLMLPSEAQWEYACRAGTNTPYFFGDTPNPEEIHFKSGAPVEVRAKPANAWGLYQMHGNVWEWCADAWHDNHEGIDPTGLPRPASQPATDVARVIRGGSWNDDARNVRAAYRNRARAGGAGRRLPGLPLRYKSGQPGGLERSGRPPTGSRGGAAIRCLGRGAAKTCAGVGRSAGCSETADLAICIAFGSG